MTEENLKQSILVSVRRHVIAAAAAAAAEENCLPATSEQHSNLDFKVGIKYFCIKFLFSYYNKQSDKTLQTAK